MNCFNCKKYLQEAIESVYAQTYQNYEIIFWDNASTDGSDDIAKSFDGRLRYFRSKETVSLGQARNMALDKIQGEYIAFLDCDDIWLPEKLEKQVPAFQKNPGIGLIYSDGYYFNHKGNILRFYEKRSAPSGNVFRKLLANYFLVMPTVMIRNKALSKLTYWFDERFSIIEEGDLFLRISHDWLVDFIPEPLAGYRLHSNNLGYTNRILWGEEMQLLIATYERLYKSFVNRYKEEIIAIEADISYVKAMDEWARGNSNTAREILRTHIHRKKKYLLVYLLSMLPYRYIKKILQLKRLHYA